MTTFQRYICSLLGALGAFSGVTAGTPSSPVQEGDLGIAIEQLGVLTFPVSMLYNGIYSGEVRAAISVDQDGKLTDVLVTGYTDKAFADASVAALKRWKYKPALVHGRAQTSRADIVFTFREQGVIVHSLPGAVERAALLGMMQQRYVYQPCLLKDLDRIPTPVHVVTPAINVDTTRHSVTVGFFIDEEGRVRMPSVPRKWADDLYAAAAVEAVEQWRFEPPLRKGRPVLVHAEQEFNFVAKK